MKEKISPANTNTNKTDPTSLMSAMISTVKHRNTMTAKLGTVPGLI